eukprot:6391462-Pyramimonas_sp.AAC.1
MASEEEIRAAFHKVVPITFDSDVIDYLVSVVAEELETHQQRPNHAQLVDSIVDSIGPFLLQDDGGVAEEDVPRICTELVSHLLKCQPSSNKADESTSNVGNNTGSHTNPTSSQGQVATLRPSAEAFVPGGRKDVQQTLPQVRECVGANKTFYQMCYTTPHKLQRLAYR